MASAAGRWRDYRYVSNPVHGAVVATILGPIRRVLPHPAAPGSHYSSTDLAVVQNFSGIYLHDCNFISTVAV
jgi:hypothetical protein